MKHSLCLFFYEENLWRCRARISSEETLNYGMTFPILFQRSSNFTKLIILYHHCGVEAMLNHIRNFYLIVKGKKQLNRYYENVLICNVIQKKAAIPVDTPALPPFRIQFSYCFKNVGLHYAVPLFYNCVVQIKPKKCYVLLFTCSVSRATHLELTNNLQSMTKIMGKTAIRTISCFYPLPPLNNFEKQRAELASY